MTEPQQFLIYQSEDGSTRIDVMLEAETLWLNQKQLTELFGKAKGTVSEHIKHIFEDGELTPAATVRLFRTVQSEGGRDVTREVEHYNLDMVLALGFRVRSPVGMRFRQWANDKLKEYIVKGFVLDDARLKNPDKGRDYFDELIRRLQDIRTSERRFYQKITDIYATSADYDAHHPLTQEFFATVQNKVHYAIHGQTAAELIAARADSSQPNMGLSTWEGARIRKADVSIVKNYLNEEELRALNNLAEQYLIFAEGQAARRIAMTMQDWISKLEGFLTLNDREILQGAGKMSAELARSQTGVRQVPGLGRPAFRVGLRSHGEAVAREETAVMDFRIADTFTDSLARLTGEEQKLVKTHRLRPATEPGKSGVELPQTRRGEGQAFPKPKSGRIAVKVINHLGDEVFKV